MGDRAINNTCLIHKIALVWSISRNTFQPIGYAAKPCGTTKKCFFDFCEALYNS